MEIVFGIFFRENSLQSIILHQIVQTCLKVNMYETKKPGVVTVKDPQFLF